MNNQKRRDFIKTGTILGGALMSSSFVSNEKKVNSSHLEMKISEKRKLGSGKTV